MHIRKIGDRKDFKFVVKVECASHRLRTTNRPWGAWSGHMTH